MNSQLEHVEMLRNMSQKLDNLIESLQIGHLDLKSAMEKIYLFLKEELEIDIFYLETKDESLISKAFIYGDCGNDLKQKTPQLLDITNPDTFETITHKWFVQPLEVAGKNIGNMGIAFNFDNAPKGKAGIELLDTISEELDNFFFGIQQSSLKHSIIMGIQSALKSQSISDAIDRAVYVLKKQVPFSKLLIIYSDVELTGQEEINYMIYDDIEKCYDSNTNPHPALDKFIEENSSPMSAGGDELKSILNEEELTVSYLLDGLINEHLIGKAIFVPQNGKNFSIFAREIIQVFTESLRQRLVDFNRERNNLRKFFSDKVINKLVSNVGYDELYLTPREENIGIIFADISGFTKMSEQILKTPEKITKLVDHWAEGILHKVFPYGAALDKLVGDCIILLFGPPFYDSSKDEQIKAALESAKEIVKFTQDFLRRPENKDIQEHPDFDKFGVAIGVNHCPAVVGLIGPNKDLTAFSSGMNITARLQGLAHADQILVTEEVKKVAINHGYEFGEEHAEPVKNVEKPLTFFQLKA
jgi:class 3 adenylate cyclase